VDILFNLWNMLIVGYGVQCNVETS